MSTRAMKCPRCEASMTPGFPVDRADKVFRMQSWWVEGQPQRSKLTGAIKVKKSKVFAIETYRCTRCGYLESYANTPPEDPWWS